MTGLRNTLAAIAAPGRRWSARLAGLFVLWAVAHELATGAGFINAVSRPPGSLLLVAAGLAALAAALGEPFTGRGTAGGRTARALALVGAGLLLLAPPLSLVTRETRMLSVGEGQELPSRGRGGLPALRIGRFTLAPRGPFPLSKTVEVPLETADGEEIRVGLFPPARLAGWRLTVFEFGYAPAVSWVGSDGATIAEGFMMLGTFPRTEEESRLVEWLPQPNVMMGVGTFPPKVEDLLTPPGTNLHLHLRLQEATIGGVRRNLADPEAYRWVMDGHPTAHSLFVEVFDGAERRYAGTIPSGSGAEFPGGHLFVAPELALWADIQAVRDPFVEIFLAGGAALVAGALAGLATLAVGRTRRGG